jgi:hypothetical protein
VYMPGLRRTGSSPLRTSMSAASYRLVIQSFSQSPDWIYVPGGILARNCAAMHTQKRIR